VVARADEHAAAPVRAARDRLHALAAHLGLLIARRGAWGGRQLLPAAWVEAMTTPSPTNGSYGYLWWLNRAGVRYRGAPESCFYATGAGSNIIWIDPDHDIVAVMRWIDKAAVGGFLTRLTEAAA
jgi:CubicO group peptidase (beta-lactamase class C family)